MQVEQKRHPRLDLFLVHYMEPWAALRFSLRISNLFKKMFDLFLERPS